MGSPSASTSPRYERIGRGYAQLRRQDPRLAHRLREALGDASTVVNVGAGAGSYEPRDRHVIAIEPSDVMAAQRPPELAPAIRADAGTLPLRDGSVDAALAVLTVHHWDTQQQPGVRELRRVTRGPVVIVTFDQRVSSRMWLVADYLPEVAELDRRIFPSIDELAGWLGGRTHTELVPVARDTPDWTLAAFWAHPERVADPAARGATSGFSRMDERLVGRAVDAVGADLASGEWDRRHGDLRSLAAFDAGMRLLVNTPD
ncbi:MAG TPA: methyltransferase domain-containing protein [Solirubrobacteraceae bacterium]|jgi:SAM-dependent methyltransferase|nr:methyltransferase domain-containing protein [Solirubrobacteraceae bacterium]